MDYKNHIVYQHNKRWNDNTTLVNGTLNISYVIHAYTGENNMSVLIETEPKAYVIFRCFHVIVLFHMNHKSMIWYSILQYRYRQFDFIHSDPHTHIYMYIYIYIYIYAAMKVKISFSTSIVALSYFIYKIRFCYTARNNTQNYFISVKKVYIQAINISSHK